jgi:hypothetical protein
MEQIQCDWCNQVLIRPEVDAAKVLMVRTGTVIFELNRRAHQIRTRNYKEDENGTAQGIPDGQGNESESESAVDGRL